MVKAKTFWKSLFRLIQKTKSRYLNLMAIVAIGVSFFVGVTSSSGILAHSVSYYNQQQGLKHVTLYSNYGFEAEDLDQIKLKDKVASSQASYFEDVEVSDSETTRVTRVHSFLPSQKINQFELVEGRMPQQEGEVLAEKGSGILPGFSLSSSLKVSRKKDSILKQENYTVVGLVNTSLYLNQMKESSTLQKQAISTYLYLPESGFNSDRYRQVDLLLKGEFSLDEFSESFKQQQDSIKATLKPELEDLGKKQGERVKEKALSKYQEGYQEYSDGLAKYQSEKQEADKKFLKAHQDIEEKESLLNQAKDQLTKGKQQWNEQNLSFLKKKKESLDQLAEAKSQLTLQKQNLNSQKQALELQQSQLVQKKEKLQKQQTSLIQAKEALNQLSLIEQQIQAIQAQEALWKDQPDSTVLSDIPGLLIPGFDSSQTIQALKTYYAQQKTLLEQGLLGLSSVMGTTISEKLEFVQKSLDALSIGLKELERGEEQINSGLSQLEAGLAQIEQGQQSLSQKEQEALAQLDQGETQLKQAKQTLVEKEAQWKDGVSKLESGKQELLSQEEKAQKEFQKAEWELTKAKHDLEEAKETIDQMKDGEWTYLDRSKHYASVTFQNTVDQMKAIARIFPVFFVLVATLVCLTTMTRLVEEDRMELGTLRALGYKRSQLLAKYAAYSLSATLVGLALGVFFGMISFPIIIYEAWKMMFILPKLQMEIPWLFIGETCLAFLGVMLLTTWFAIHLDTQEVPASLMRPKAPGKAKKVFLERIPWLWNRFSFLHKVTFRNLIRYKKRFFMTMIGIAGCSALMVMGFGIRDSISSLIQKQYEEIIHFDGRVEVKENMDDVRSYLSLSNQFSLLEEGHSFSSEVRLGEKEVNLDVYVAKPNTLANLFHLKDLQDHSISFSKAGLILSEKAARTLSVKEGEALEVENALGKTVKIPLVHISKYYSRNAIWMSEESYQEAYGETASSNSFFVKVKPGVSVMESEGMILKNPHVTHLDFFRSIIENFNQMIKGLNAIVWVLIVSSMTLAFVVLQNLISLNIAERTREIATLKVLGFRKKEIERYVFQENLILTALAALVGLPLGVVLHRLIMETIQVENILFPIEIHWSSFVYSFVLTTVFGILVTQWMRRYIHEIEMVESLKSLE